MNDYIKRRNARVAAEVARILAGRNVTVDSDDMLDISTLPLADQVEVGKAVIRSLHEPFEIDPDRYLREGAGAVWAGACDWARNYIDCDIDDALRAIYSDPVGV